MGPLGLMVLKLNAYSGENPLISILNGIAAVTLTEVKLIWLMYDK